MVMRGVRGGERWAAELPRCERVSSHLRVDCQASGWAESITTVGLLTSNYSSL